ncbi:hypothetical protein DPMN_143844 [Dreissena polymorpha]|uniref:Uncharacterized protein n=1 Tax=Dreissena polymorpha TaxID=45954 RepID=A0A9D4GEB5_DREPO|nr:hypothetical protein DPMN_143844 [Dreissena polymorpha]
MHRIAGTILPRRKWSSLMTLAFIHMCVYLFANCEQQLVHHIHGTLKYNICSDDTCPKPSGLYGLTTVRVNCIKTDGIFNCTLPENDCAYFIYGHVHAKDNCKRQSYCRGNVSPAIVDLSSSSAKIGDLTTMKMTLKGTHDAIVPYFSVHCPYQGFNDSVQIFAHVYRCF